MVLTKIGHGNLRSPQKGELDVHAPLAGKILYVEDEAPNWEVAQLALSKTYELVRAISSQEVFAALNSNEFDLILMDIQLQDSELNGIEITQCIRGKHPNSARYGVDAKYSTIPIIFMTAYTATYRREEVLDYGGDDIIYKPINFAKLAAAMSRILNDNRLLVIAAQRESLEAERRARQSEHEALLNVQQAHAKLTQELEARRRVEGELNRMEGKLVSSQEELHRAGEVLRQAQKLSTFGELTAGVAHEVINPLSTALYSLELVSEKLTSIWESLELVAGDSADGKQFLEKLKPLFDSLDKTHSNMEISLRQILTLADALRKGSRSDSEYKGAVDLNEIVDRALIIISGKARKCKMNVVKGDLPGIYCQPNFVLQVIINLISNAVSAVFDNEGCKPSERRFGIRTRAYSKGENLGVSVIVEDSGPGVPEELRSKIFETFYTTKDAQSGTGLGLSISKSIVEEHDGVFEVSRSDEFGGARFEVWLPVSPDHKFK